MITDGQFLRPIEKGTLLFSVSRQLRSSLYQYKRTEGVAVSKEFAVSIQASGGSGVESEEGSVVVSI